MITFRVSAEEYDEVRAASVDRGMRSVSEFARAAVEQMMHGRRGSSVSAELRDLQRQVRLLGERVAKMSAESGSHPEAGRDATT